jgi:hypothetical protein
METCSICIEPIDPGSCVTIDCGHTFHSNCAIQWFRYNHTSCPLCRSDSVESRWNRTTPSQRIARLKRVKHVMSRNVQKCISKYEKVTKKLRDDQQLFTHFKRENKIVLRENARLSTKVRTIRHKKVRLMNELASIHIPNAPHLHPRPNEDNVSDMADSEFSDNDGVVIEL